MRSDAIKKGFERAPHRSLLKATGVTDADMGKPFIAVCNSYVDIIPGHVHLQAVGEQLRMAALAAILDVVVDRMVVAGDGLEGGEIRLGQGAAGDVESLAHRQILEIARRGEAVPAAVEAIAHDAVRLS